MKNDYLLLYRDYPVLEFNPENKAAHVINQKLLPIICQNVSDDFDKIKSFTAYRILQMNREYCKEILTSCCIEDQTDINICLISHALSFRDNYWIKQSDSNLKWKDINLYHNPFSEEISFTALTGETKAVTINDSIYTGELTGKGTRPKCFIRQNNNLFLAKAETHKEIGAEIISSVLLKQMNTPAAKYLASNVYSKDVSVCHIKTSEDREMIHCEDFLKYFKCKMSYDSKYYAYFMQLDSKNFIKMQLFDYITLNTDRNRNNFAIERLRGRYKGIYPLYDHDSCFKGKSDSGIYFPTHLSFAKTMDLLKTYPEYELIIPDIKKLYEFMQIDGKTLLEDNGHGDNFDNTMTRIEKALSYTNSKKILPRRESITTRERFTIPEISESEYNSPKEILLD